MDFKKIKGKENYIYDNIDEFNAFCPNLKVVGSWRKGNEGDWVFTDDDFIVQILKKSKIAHPSYKNPRTYIRTICGSYIVEQKTHLILGEKGIAENIYSFSNNDDSKKDYSKCRKLKSRQFLFARYIAEGNDVISAVKKAYPKATKERYIAQRASSLLNKEEVRTMIKEEREQLLKENDVAPGWIVQQYKQIAELSERDSDKLRSLEALAKMSGLFDTETKKEQLSVFQGFTPEQMESLSGKETKLIATGEKETKS